MNKRIICPHCHARVEITGDEPYTCPQCQQRFSGISTYQEREDTDGLSTWVPPLLYLLTRPSTPSVKSADPIPDPLPEREGEFGGAGASGDFQAPSSEPDSGESSSSEASASASFSGGDFGGGGGGGGGE